MVSIIVPVYNNLTYLERCVESLVNQTYQDIEILLVDDGSCDGTEVLCDQLAKQWEKVKVCHKENGGTSSARNHGIRNAQGEAFSFVDSDDCIAADMIQKLVEAMERTGQAIIQIGREEREEDGRVRDGICQIPGEETFYSSEEFMKELLLHKGDCSFCTKLVKRELFSEDMFPEGELNEDFYLLTRMLPKVKGVVSLPFCGYYVYYRMGSNTRKQKGGFSRVFWDNVVNADRVNKLVQEHYPQLSRVAVRFGLVQRLDYLLHIPLEQMTKENENYMEICRYLKAKKKEISENPYLSKKNRSYLYLLRIAPKKVRQLHYLSMVLRGKVN